jgi:hypothetical protein
MESNAGAITAIVELNNADIMVGHDTGKLTRWRRDKLLGKEIESEQGYIASLIQLTNGEVLSSGGSFRGPLGLPSRGSFRRWRDGAPADATKAIGTKQGLVRPIFTMGDGSVISGGDDGSIRRWHFYNGGATSTVIGRHTASISALLPLGNGSFYSAGADGIVRHWKNPDQPAPSSFIPVGNGEVTILSLENGDLLIAEETSGRVRKWQEGKLVTDTKVVGVSGINSMLEYAKDVIIIGGSDGGIRVINDPFTQGQINLLLPRKHKGPVKLLRRLGRNHFVSADEDNLFFWKYGSFAKAANFTSSLELPCKGLHNVVTVNNGGILIACREAGVFSFYDGKLRRAMKASGDNMNMRVLGLLPLPNNDVVAAYENGNAQVWRGDSQYQSPFTLVGTGGMYRGLGGVSLALLSSQDWISSVNGHLSGIETLALRRWRIDKTPETGQALLISARKGLSNKDLESSYIDEVLVSRKGEIIIRLSGANPGVALYSLPMVVRSACSRIDLDSLSQRADLTAVMKMAKSTCKS